MAQTARTIADWMAEWADPAWAESYDNVGLLIGHEEEPVDTVVTALDATEGAVDYALSVGAQMLVTHHPLMFRATRRITDADRDGARLLKIIERRLAVCACHTNMDAALGGTNDLVVERLGLLDVRPLRPIPDAEGAGMGRIGILPHALTIAEFADLVKKVLEIPAVRVVSAHPETRLYRVALCTGKGMDFYEDAVREQADVFLTGDVVYHEAEEALLRPTAIVDAGHFGTEYPIADAMAQYLHEKDDLLSVYPYTNAKDPFIIL